MDINRKKFLKKPNENNEIQYKRSKKEYNNDIKKAKNAYYGDELFRAQKDSKKLWSIINSLIQNRTKSDPIKSIKFDDKILTDNKEIAEVFSNYYKYAAIKKVNEIKSEVNFEHFLNEKDKARRVQMCLDKVEHEPDWLDNLWFSDEAWFYLQGVVNSHSNVYWGTVDIVATIDDCFCTPLL